MDNPVKQVDLSFWKHGVCRPWERECDRRPRLVAWLWRMRWPVLSLWVGRMRTVTVQWPCCAMEEKLGGPAPAAARAGQFCIFLEAGRQRCRGMSLMHDGVGFVFFDGWFNPEWIVRQGRASAADLRLGR